MFITTAPCARGVCAMSLAFTIAALLLFILPQPLVAGPGHAGAEGHAHDAPAVASSQSPRVVATSENYQLVGILKAGQLTLFLDREADNAPVEDAAISLASGSKSVAAKRQPDGTFVVVPTDDFFSPGENEIQFTISEKQRTDLLGGVLTLPVPAPSHLAAVSQGTGLQHLLARSMAQLRSLQIPLSVAAMVAAALFAGVLVGSLFKRGAALLLAIAIATSVYEPPPARAGPGHAGGEGHSHGPETAAGANDFPQRLPDGTIFFPKPTQRLVHVRTLVIEPQTVRRTLRLPGRIVPDPGRAAIVQSSLEGRILPANGIFARPGQIVTAGELLAHVQPALTAISQSEVEQAAGQLDQQIALLVNRVEQMRRFTTFPAERVRAAELELAELNKRRDTLASRHGGAALEPLTAPIAGVVTAVNAQIGQIVSPRDVLFQIVDAKQHWIEAVSYEPIDESAFGRIRVALDGQGQSDVRLVGRSSVLQHQAVVLSFAFDNTTKIDLGRRVDVFAENGKEMTGPVVPRTAIVQAPNGQFVVFKHVEPEKFESRPVRFIEVDGQRALLTAGIETGDKLVIVGASLINQVR